ncbi:MAG: HmuY family protein [Treponema sp.]|nr:HmuY family protein [Treponema sp.]
MKKNFLFGLIGIFLIFSFALTGCPTTSSGTNTETSVIKVTNVPEGTTKIFVSVYDDFTTKTTLAWGEAAVSGGSGTLSLLTPGGKAWTGTDTVAIAALADRASGKRWDSVDLGEEIMALDWSAGGALEGELFDAVKSNAQIISPITEEELVELPTLDDELTFDIAGVPKYYSLSTGEEVEASKANTKEWDIAFEAHPSSMLSIYTNSGDTATEKGSAGDGGVWYTDSTDFDAVALTDKVNASGDYEPYVTDQIRWLPGMSGATPMKMNMMTYFGFASGGDGLTKSTPFTSSGMAVYAFNKKAAYKKTNPAMPPQYGPTEQVYIIRHADGTTYSKFQLSGLSFVGASSSPTGRNTYSATFKYGAVE